MNKNLPDKIREMLAESEAYSLKESYVHCQGGSVRAQTELLSAQDQALWFAGHHSGFHAGIRAERSRTAALDALWPEVVALAEVSHDHHNNPPITYTNCRACVLLDKLQAVCGGEK